MDGRRRDDLAGIFFIGRDSRIDDNVVVVVVQEQAPTPLGVFRANGGLGGIQLGGGCDRVKVRGNRIQSGVGNGITLGSISTLVDGEWVVGGWVVNADDPCNPCRPGDTGVPPGDGDGGPQFRSDGPLVDIEIRDNEIRDMGLNGIGVIGFFALSKVPELVSVYGLTIVENEIRFCLIRPLALIEQQFANILGYGGIALADVSALEIRENVIEDNGADYREPVCGIYLLYGEGVEIVENRIANNGHDLGELASQAKAGPRGGIYIAACTPPLGPPGSDAVAGRSASAAPVPAPPRCECTATASSPRSGAR